MKVVNPELISTSSFLFKRLQEMIEVYNDVLVEGTIEYSLSFLMFSLSCLLPFGFCLDPQGFFFNLLCQLFHVDGLTPCGVRQHLEAKDNCAKDLIPLLGKSGQVWGMVRFLLIPIM